MRPLALVVLALLAAGCAQPSPEPAPVGAPSGPFAFHISEFRDNGAIPKENSCDGVGTAPTLNVTGAPAGAATLALIVIDPDVPIPQAPTQTITHWTAWNVPLVGGAAAIEKGKAPDSAREGLNSGGSNGWMPPCPPVGSPAHRYIFSVFAVQGGIDLPAGSSRAQLEAALQGKTLANATITGLYARALPP